METTKKQAKVKYFTGSFSNTKTETKINEFLLQRPLINVKSITIDHTGGVMLLYEE